MKRIHCTLFVWTLATGVQAAALPGNAAEGKRLHDANCTGCHDSGVYTQKERTIRSLGELRQQVQGCSRMAKKEFSQAETQNLIKYLNDSFYRFE